MRNLHRLLLGFVGIIILTGEDALTEPAWADQADLLSIQWEPKSLTRQGKIESCGLSFSLSVRATSETDFGVFGSVNSFIGSDSLVLALKLDVLEKKSDGPPLRRAVSFASLRVGQLNTRDFRRVEADNSMSWLSAGSLAEFPDVVGDLPLKIPEGAWLSFAVENAEDDYVVRLPPFAKADYGAFEEYAECWLQMERHLEQ